MQLLSILLQVVQMDTAHAAAQAVATATGEASQDLNVFELVKNDMDRQLLELQFTPQTVGRPFVAPPGIPAERVAILRSAFNATMRDPEFLAEAAKQRMDVNPISGDEIHKLLERVYSSPPQLIERARAFIKQHGWHMPGCCWLTEENTPN